jgi:hypothetical protein
MLFPFKLFLLLLTFLAIIIKNQPQYNRKKASSVCSSKFKKPQLTASWDIVLMIAGGPAEVVRGVVRRTKHIQD